MSLFFQQNDGGQGSGETRYVDHIAVLTEGAPIYLPDAPKLLTVTATNCANLLWRDNDCNESGFKIERSAETNGAWIEIASVSSNLTNYADGSVKDGTNYPIACVPGTPRAAARIRMCVRSRCQAVPRSRLSPWESLWN